MPLLFEIAGPESRCAGIAPVHRRRRRLSFGTASLWRSAAPRPESEGFVMKYRCRLNGLSPGSRRSEEHTSELQSLMRISYAVFCLKKQKDTTQERHNSTS